MDLLEFLYKSLIKIALKYMNFICYINKKSAKIIIEKSYKGGQNNERKINLL